MQIRDFFAEVAKKIRTSLGGPANPHFSVGDHELDPALARQFGEASSHDMAKLFFNHDGRVICKWVHYLDVYEKEFAHWRAKAVSLLEIGVSEGGSLQLWRAYFGDDATVFGIDIDPACAGRVDPPNQVRIGSQDDPEFLQQVVAEMGPPDIVLDDGSHIGRHQLASFTTLFPLMAPGSLYVIEDLHSSYWPGFYEGGYRRAGSGVEIAKTLIDDMHAWYHSKPCRLASQTTIAAVRCYDSIVVIEKGRVKAPRQIRVGLDV